jgi:hypothetical protein
MTRTPTITLMAPCSLLSANDRRHWAVQRKLVKAWRDMAHWQAKADKLPPLPVPVRIVATVHRPDRTQRRWDAGNYAPTAKAIVDGLVDAGLLPDDANRYVTGPDMRAGEGWAKAAIVLTFEPAPDAQALAPEPLFDPLWS